MKTENIFTWENTCISYKDKSSETWNNQENFEKWLLFLPKIHPESQIGKRVKTQTFFFFEFGKVYVFISDNTHTHIYIYI